MTKLIRRKALLTFSAAAALAALAGCASAPPAETRLPNYSQVAFERPLRVPAGFRVTDETDRKQLVLAGLRAFEREQWAVAAGYFERAAQAVHASERGEFQAAAWASAALAYLNAGDRQAFLRAAGAMEGHMSFHQRVNPRPEAALVLGLKARMEEKPLPAPGLLPHPVRRVLGVP